MTERYITLTGISIFNLVHSRSRFSGVCNGSAVRSTSAIGSLYEDVSGQKDDIRQPDRSLTPGSGPGYVSRVCKGKKGSSSLDDCGDWSYSCSDFSGLPDVGYRADLYEHCEGDGEWGGTDTTRHHH
jgi:hypothetical protein